MATISIARKHHLTHAKARSAAEKIAKDLQKRYGLDYEWNGDALDFERPGITGRMKVDKDTLKLDVSLGFLLSAMKSTIEREIGAELDKLLPPAKSPAR